MAVAYYDSALRAAGHLGGPLAGTTATDPNYIGNFVSVGGARLSYTANTWSIQGPVGGAVSPEIYWIGQEVGRQRVEHHRIAKAEVVVGHAFAAGYKQDPNAIIVKDATPEQVRFYPEGPTIQEAREIDKTQVVPPRPDTGTRVRRGFGWLVAAGVIGAGIWLWMRKRSTAR